MAWSIGIVTRRGTGLPPFSCSMWADRYACALFILAGTASKSVTCEYGLPCRLNRYSHFPRFTRSPVSDACLDSSFISPPIYLLVRVPDQTSHSNVSRSKIFPSPFV